MVGATSLFVAGVPERIIQGRNGHISTDALRKYERVTEQQELAALNIFKWKVDSSLPELVACTCESETSSHTVSPPTAVPATSGLQYNNCTINYYSMLPFTRTMFLYQCRIQWHQCHIQLVVIQVSLISVVNCHLENALYQ